MLDNRSEIGPRSDFSRTVSEDKLQAYYQQGAMSRSNSDMGYPMNHGEHGSDIGYGPAPVHSTDNLLYPTPYGHQSTPSRKPSVREYNNRHKADDPVAFRPLLEANESDVHLPGSLSRQQSSGSINPPYPPAQFQSPPVGYVPPSMSRQDSFVSDEEARYAPRHWDNSGPRFQ
jgi:hypothetical protein